MRAFTRSTTAIFLTLCLAAPALAKMPARFGVRAGVNLSAFGGEFGDAVQPDSRVAPNLSAFYELPLSPQLAFHGEVGYSGKGGKTENESTDVFGNPTTIKSDWQFNYIEVPLMLRGRFGSLGKATPFFELGPSLGFAVSGKFEMDPAIIADTNLTDDMKGLDVGWAAGTGVEFPAGPGRLGVEARFTRGFSDLFDLSDNAAAINQAWTFALSFSR